MVLDEPGKDDTVFSEQGISFMVENNLLERVKPIKIDFVDTPMGSGFIINSSLKKKRQGMRFLQLLKRIVITLSIK